MCIGFQDGDSPIWCRWAQLLILTLWMFRFKGDVAYAPHRSVDRHQLLHCASIFFPYSRRRPVAFTITYRTAYDLALVYITPCAEIMECLFVLSKGKVHVSFTTGVVSYFVPPSMGRDIGWWCDIHNTLNTAASAQFTIQIPYVIKSLLAYYLMDMNWHICEFDGSVPVCILTAEMHLSFRSRPVAYAHGGSFGRFCMMDPCSRCDCARR